MGEKESFREVFARLKRIYSEVPGAVITTDQPDDYSLNTPYSPRYKKELFLGAVQVKKNYVSFHLMPVYMFPELLEDISPELRKRMQGKSCLNFNSIDEGLFKELEALARRGIDRMRREGLL